MFRLLDAMYVSVEKTEQRGRLGLAPIRRLIVYGLIKKDTIRYLCCQWFRKFVLLEGLCFGRRRLFGALSKSVIDRLHELGELALEFKNKIM